MTVRVLAAVAFGLALLLGVLLAAGQSVRISRYEVAPAPTLPIVCTTAGACVLVGDGPYVAVRS